MMKPTTTALRSNLAKNWLAGALNPAHKGLLHRELGVKPGVKIPAAKLAKAAKGNSPLAKRARLAETMRGFQHG